jgi:glycosyltransferase involved in cell wall biosynthesis
VKRLLFTVTNDLTYDQRMHRICDTLARNGYEVLLVGRERSTSLPLLNKTFQQKRLRCFFNNGILFYIEYNIRLTLFLLRERASLFCAIDLDTILPVLLVSLVRKKTRVYDAHEFFTELKEVHTRPFIQSVWRGIERIALPRFEHGYTVGQGIAREFNKLYKRDYEVIRNMPVKRTLAATQRKNFILYQGAVNEGRGFEYLVPAMIDLPYQLVICGDGNFMEQLKVLIRIHGVEDKVQLKGMMLPERLRVITLEATIGIGLTEKEGLNQYLALPNKFFDYIEAALPQVAMDLPEYRTVNEQFEVAVLLNDLSPANIAERIRELMENEEKRNRLHHNCMAARELFCWQEEEKKLLAFYKNILV